MYFVPTSRFAGLLLVFSLLSQVHAQTFLRSELSAELDRPWELIYGPDHHLWVTERNGTVSRVDPRSGEKEIVWIAPDYFAGDSTERSPFCHNPVIGHGTLGMTLHPDFTIPGKSYLYFLYSYNSGTESAPKTALKIERLLWDATDKVVVENTAIVSDLSVGYDHLGGRMLAVKRNGRNELYVALGDNGISEDNAFLCYEPQSLNPNNYTQDPYTPQGKIHRFLMDGSIPADNPIPGNSFFTRGHRHPQGLAYNVERDVLYNIEHGDRTDDEINVLEAGMNYGWKDVRGYVDDGFHPGEVEYAAQYQPHPDIPDDHLVDPLYSWCADIASASIDNSGWCTVAPSDGLYYGEGGIPGWQNSLLVVTLKDGMAMDREVWRIRLSKDGKGLAEDGIDVVTSFFGEDQALNGRLRDIATDPTGQSLFLINNGAADRDKITRYDYNTGPLPWESVKLYPNPAVDRLVIQVQPQINKVEIVNSLGRVVDVYTFGDGPGSHLLGNSFTVNTSTLPPGIYFAKVTLLTELEITKRFVKVEP